MTHDRISTKALLARLALAAALLFLAWRQQNLEQSLNENHDQAVTQRRIQLAATRQNHRDLERLLATLDQVQATIELAQQPGQPGQ